MMRLRSAAPVLAAGLGAGAVLLFQSAFRGPAKSDLYSSATILERVQALGDLHTIRLTFSQTFEKDSAMRPMGTVGHLPGMPELIQASTRNVALVSATGSVEAGVDLRRARFEGGRLILPRATIYPTVADLKLHNSRGGLFWRDNELPLRAQNEAERRFSAAAEQAGIRAQAEREAVIRVEALLNQASVKIPVEIG